MLFGLSLMVSEIIYKHLNGAGNYFYACVKVCGNTEVHVVRERDNPNNPNFGVVELPVNPREGLEPEEVRKA